MTQHYPITPGDIMIAMNSAVIGADGCVYVLLPSLDLPGDPPAIQFDIETQAEVVFNSIWSHHVPAIRNGEMPLVKKATHHPPSAIQ